MKLPQTGNYRRIRSARRAYPEPRSRVRNTLYWFARFIGSPELTARFGEPQPKPLIPGEGDPTPIPGGPCCGPDARPAPSPPDPLLSTRGRKVFRPAAVGMRLPAGDTEMEAD